MTMRPVQVLLAYGADGVGVGDSEGNNVGVRVGHDTRAAGRAR